MNYYILTFDRKIGSSYKEFHDDFVDHPQFNRWFHYIKSSYIIGTTLAAGEITDHFLKVAERYNLPKIHFVVRVNLSYRGGWLTEDAWNWFGSNSKS